MKTLKPSQKKVNEENIQKSVEDNDCTSVMHPEMARNYEDDQPCNDGTKKRKGTHK